MATKLERNNFKTESTDQQSTDSQSAGNSATRIPRKSKKNQKDLEMVSQILLKKGGFDISQRSNSTFPPSVMTINQLDGHHCRYQ